MHVDEPFPRPFIDELKVRRHVRLLVHHLLGGLLPGDHLLVQLYLEYLLFLLDFMCFLQHAVVCPFEDLLRMHLSEHIALVNIVETLDELVLNLCFSEVFGNLVHDLLAPLVDVLELPDLLLQVLPLVLALAVGCLPILVFVSVEGGVEHFEALLVGSHDARAHAILELVADSLCQVLRKANCLSEEAVCCVLH